MLDNRRKPGRDIKCEGSRLKGDRGRSIVDRRKSCTMIDSYLSCNQTTIYRRFGNRDARERLFEARLQAPLQRFRPHIGPTVKDRRATNSSIGVIMPTMHVPRVPRPVRHASRRVLVVASRGFIQLWSQRRKDDVSGKRLPRQRQIQPCMHY